MPVLRPVTAALIAIASYAAAQDDCPHCASAFAKQPDIQAWMSAHGFPASDYSIVVAWTEAGADATPVYGYRLAPRAGGDAFDVYSGPDGTLLDHNALASLGVEPKPWGAVAIETDAETATGEAAPAIPSPIATTVKAQPEEVVLPTLDRQQLMEADANSNPGEKGVIRTGVFQTLPKPLNISAAKSSIGTWQTFADGRRMWSSTVVSPGAVGQRIEFRRLSLPEGGYAIVYNSDDPNERYGPFDRIPSGDAVLWSPTCFNESVTIEVVVHGTGAGVVDVAVERIAHVYRGLDELPWGATKAPAGACNLDLACYEDWITTANGVGGLGLVGNTGTLFCTGTLIVDTDPATQVPYVLTANHCTPGGGRAPSSVEVYWFYQRPTCGGAAPDPATVPRTTGGADLMATSFANRPSWTGTDFTLLRLRNAPASGSTFVGWTAQPQSIGGPTACIHHPRGDYKRITFGNYTNDADGCFVGTPPPASMYLQSTWYDGTTEGGSSGSPLIRQDTQRIIGQLWGGYASCTATACPDYYGRFDVSFPMMAAYLNPGAGNRTVQFSAATLEVDEGEGEATLTVVLSAAPAGSEVVSVAYATAQGSAKDGSDFTGVSGTIVFNELQDSAVITIPIYEEGVIEEAEGFTIALSGPVGATLGSASTATITIVDNDVDSDSDGLSNYDEVNATYGYVTEPDDEDTDDDTVNDWLEILLGTDPTNGIEFPSIPSLTVPWFK